MPSWPTGIKLCTVVFGKGVSPAGNLTGSSLLVEPIFAGTTSIVWAADGTPILPFSEKAAAVEGAYGSITLPIVDQSGFLDDGQHPFTMWGYRLTETPIYGGNYGTSRVKYWQPVTGQTNVDFDLIPNGALGLPMAGPQAVVTSVNGQTGAVTVTGGSGGTATDASTTTKGVVQLAGDLAGTAAAPTVPGKATAMTVTAVKAAAYSAVANEIVPVDASSGAVTVTLPNTAADKTRVTVKKIDTSVNAVTVAAAGSDVFNKAGGSTSIILQLTNQAATFQYAASTAVWYLVGSDVPLSQLDSRFAAAGSGGAVDASATVKGVVRLTGDLGGTAASPTVPGLTSKADLVGGKVPASQLPAASGGTAVLPDENIRTALTRLYVPAADRNNVPVYVVACGDSWTFGTGSSGNGYRWIDRLNTRLQTYWPLDSGAAGAAVGYLGNLGSNPNGLRVIGNGHSGATASSYLPTSEINQITALAPAMVIHAIGLNDQAQGVTKATYKANVLAAVNAIRSGSTIPPVQLLVRNPDLPRTVTYPWSDYGDALAEIAAAAPADVVYLDLAPTFQRAGIKSGDPLLLLTSDKGHPVDRGHAFIGETLFAAIRPQLNIGVYGAVASSIDTTAPSVPGTPTATAGTNSASVAFTSSTDNVAVTGYRVYSSADSYAAAVGTGTASPITVSSLAAGTAVTFKVAAYDAAGNLSAQSAASNSVTPTGTANTAPGAPTGLTATPGNGQAALSWTAPSSNGGATITDYVVQYSTDGSTFTTFADGVSTATTATVTGLTNGTAYTFRVAAVNSVGTGSYSATATGTAAAGSSAQATDTFTGTDGAAWSSQWTKADGAGTATIQGNQGQMAVTATQYQYLTEYLSGMTAAVDQELYVEFVFGPTNTVLCFGIDVPALSYYVPDNGYYVKIEGGGIQFCKQKSGFTQLAYTGRTMTPGTAYKLRISRLGSAIRYRLWAASASEPTAWDQNVADSTPITTAGKVFATFYNNGTVAATTTIDNVAVTTPLA